MWRLGKVNPACVKYKHWKVSPTFDISTCRQVSIEVPLTDQGNVHRNNDNIHVMSNHFDINLVFRYVELLSSFDISTFKFPNSLPDLNVRTG